MNDDEVLAWLRSEYAQPFEGFDFSYIKGRRRESADKPWDFATLMSEHLAGGTRALDLGTGTGRVPREMAAAGLRPAFFCATEGHAPNVPLAAEALRPLGVHLVHTEGDAPVTRELPFVEGAFDAVVSRHTGYRPVEIGRVLARGGVLVTQQVGDRTNLDIHRLLGRPLPRHAPWNLAQGRADLEAAGFRIEVAEEAFPTTSYADVGALVYYLKGIAWEVPDFSVDRYAAPLLALHRRGGPIEVGFHLFALVARYLPG